MRPTDTTTPTAIAPDLSYEVDLPVDGAEAVHEGMVIAGKYRLDSELAKGGMGSVWVATNLALEKQVALKVLHAQLLADEQASARLLREARTAAQLVHPNIVQIFDVGELDSGEPFIVMELLNGVDLYEKLEREGPMQPTEAVGIIIRVAQGLSAAHAKGIVHRDLKPGNIMLARDDTGAIQPKIVDFGIAKASRQEMFEPKLTMEGRVLGSPEYLSPEQAIGESDLDARTDIWALCITLYETLTGVPPFSAENYNKLLRAIIEQEPPPLSQFGINDQSLWEIIQRGLRKNRNDRWQKMEDLSLALTQWLEKTSPGLAATIAGASLLGIEHELTPAPLSLSSPQGPRISKSQHDILLAPPIPGPPVTPIRPTAQSPSSVPSDAKLPPKVLKTALILGLLGGGLALGIYLIIAVALAPRKGTRHHRSVSSATPGAVVEAHSSDIPSPQPTAITSQASPVASSTQPSVDAGTDATQPDANAPENKPKFHYYNPYRRRGGRHSPPIPLEPNF